MAFRCPTCGKEHEGLPDLGFRWPDPYFGVPEVERGARIKGTSDVCAIDNEDFFVRGVILLPIVESEDHFGIGAWVSQKRENYETYLSNFDTADIGPFFGWLSNSIAFYEPETWLHPSQVRFQGNRLRPLIELQESDHPLYRDYAEGISLSRAWQIVHAQTHPRVA
jgi:hypothetical protein